jgi:hypothetical protein
MTTSLYGKGSSPWPENGRAPNPTSHKDSGHRYGAFMEPSGRNQWQPVANRKTPKTAETSQNRCRGLRTSCRRTLMVRRGSPVRVRKRALPKEHPNELIAVSVTSGRTYKDRATRARTRRANSAGEMAPPAGDEAKPCPGSRGVVPRQAVPGSGAFATGSPVSSRLLDKLDHVPIHGGVRHTKAATIAGKGSDQHEQDPEQAGVRRERGLGDAGLNDARA